MPPGGLAQDGGDHKQQAAYHNTKYSELLVGFHFKSFLE